MTSLWWDQIKAIIRLEMKKTFFARRGLWIYVLALLPILLFLGGTIVNRSVENRRETLARQSEKTLTYQDLSAVAPGMTRDEVVALLGKPPLTFYWKQKNPGSADVLHESYQYSDGQDQLYVGLADGKVEAINLGRAVNLGDNSMMFAGIFQFFFIRLAVFFGCLGIFMNLFRGEILDRSLHFYFLAPVRREVLMAGKFLAGLLATCIIFVTSVVLQTFVFLWQFSPRVRDLYLYHNHGLEHAFAYVGITVLACVGYGAFFLVAGMLFRNPLLPAAAILIWELINPFLPAVLKQLSVIYYLKSLCPVDVPADPGTPALLAMLVSNPDPVSAPVAVLGLVAVALLALYISTVQIRRMEINYTTE